ncbi:MAG TPA: hypothetical protein VGP47_09440 [Parachlamydiaceae bacterium]|nr:hypothetical protein [Parachlamydiaceae bacterium]
MITTSPIKNFDDVNVSLYPAIGDSGISHAEIEQVIDFIINEWSTTYFKRLDEASRDNELHVPALHDLKERKGISIFANQNQEYELQDIDKGLIHIYLKLKPREIMGGNPIEKLLLALAKKISSLGYKDFYDGDFEIRLDKGRLTKSADHWHFDKTFKSSVTICWSNIKDWSTKILNIKNHSDEWNALKEMSKRPYYLDEGKIDLSKSESSDFGYFYDAINTLHRAPRVEDMENPLLESVDYRLFIRYTEK